MVGIIVTNLIEYKRGNKEALYPIIKKMEPLIHKYTKKLFTLDSEDVKQEYYISIIESINKISNYTDERQCFNYIKNAILYKFLNLYKCAVEENKFNFNTSQIDLLNEIKVEDNTQDCIFLIDLKSELNKLPVKKRTILELKIFKNMSDSDLANYLNVSRQYVNKAKKEAFFKIYNSTIPPNY